MTERHLQPKKDSLAGGLLDHTVQNHLPEFPNLLFMSHLRPDIKTAEIVDSMSENQMCHPNMWKSERKRILSEALESHFTPRSRFRSCLVW